MSDIAGFAGYDKACEMFSDLALIDWIALVFAAVMLAAAAAAGIVAYATAKNRPIRTLASDGHTPAHAATPPPPAENSVRVSASRASAPTDMIEVPAPPLLVGSSGAPVPDTAPSSEQHTNAAASEGALIEPSSAEATVAARAAKLRRRPVPDNESGHKRIVSAVEPKRMPAHAPNRAFVHSSAGQLTIDKEHTDGFAARTPGFFEDPVGRHELRYWDGHRWTEYVKEHGERFTDPL